MARLKRVVITGGTGGLGKAIAFEFAGKGWEHWLQEFNGCDDERRAQARQAIHKMGEPLTPTLIRALAREDSRLAKLNLKWGYRLPDAVRRWLPTCGKAERIREQAAQARRKG